MGFRERLINLFNRVATGTKKTRTILTPIGILFFSMLITSIMLSAVSVDKLLHLPQFLPEGARLPLSIPLILAGIAVTAWSVLHFLKAKGAPVPFNPPARVVKTGPYHYSRNPMLTGVFIFLFGAGLWLNSISLVFFFTPLFIICIIWGVKRVEEPELIKRLGNEYIEYRSRTPMFLPDFTKRPK